jgi:hypothetical protein
MVQASQNKQPIRKEIESENITMGSRKRHRLREDALIYFEIQEDWSYHQIVGFSVQVSISMQQNILLIKSLISYESVHIPEFLLKKQDMHLEQ